MRLSQKHIVLLLLFLIMISFQNPIEAAPKQLPLISRDLPAFASTNNAIGANDDSYETTWRANIPAWLAYDLSEVPESERNQVIAAWYNNATYDYDPTIVNRNYYNSLKAYTIEGNSAAGGTASAPTSGWVELVNISNNIYHSRQHVVNLSGFNWIRIKITEVNSISGDSASINLDIHNAADGIEDNWIFYGDSITAGGMVLNGSGGSFAQLINERKPDYYPIAECAGIGGLLSSDGAKHIEEWLSVFPGKYVGIAYGTNDAWGNQTGANNFYSNLETMVKAVKSHDKIPVIPTIPWSALNDIQQHLPSYNEQIEALYEAYPEIVKGPDLWTLFKNNPQYLSSDNVHPNDTGYAAIREAWADTMVENVYNSSAASINYGDLNGDNYVNSIDQVLLKRYILTMISSFPGSNGITAADLNGDNKVNSLDYNLIRRFLLNIISEFPVEA